MQCYDPRNPPIRQSNIIHRRWWQGNTLEVSVVVGDCSSKTWKPSISARQTAEAAAAGNKDAKLMVTVLEAYKAVLEQGKNARGVTVRKQGERAEGGSRPLPPHYQACTLRCQC